MGGCGFRSASTKTWRSRPLRVSTAAHTPCAIRLKAGVRHLGWITAMRLKKTPSCAMARETRAPESVQVAAALNRAGRPNDVAARFGGDEFALLVPETGIAGALQLAERIHAALQAATETMGVTVSIGAATINSEITTVDELLRAADSALYTAKRTGRGRTAGLGPTAGLAQQHLFERTWSG